TNLIKMNLKKLAEPDYDFKLEVLTKQDIEGQIILLDETIILKCTLGSSSISINSRKHHLESGSNFMLAEGLILKFIQPSEDIEITILRFSPLFFNEVYPMLDSKVVECMKLSAPDLEGDTTALMRDLIFLQLCEIYKKSNHVYRNRIVVNLVINYILEIHEQTYKFLDLNSNEPTDRRSFLVDRFFYTIYNNDQAGRHNIEYYAEKLHITSRYLHKICRETLQMTPKQCIDYMIAGNAKKLLLTTSLSNQQIANELHFPDQATFGQFFKRNVGIPPSEFRRRYK
ncbi:MAG: helix-turn-helix domain-containing protein, partial [Bacteroidales bacterium]